MKYCDARSDRSLSRRSLVVLYGALILNFIGGWHHIVQAQTNTATLSGTVADNSGAIVANASITVSNVATGLKRQTTSNAEGLFTVPLLPPGTYSLRAQRDGFSPVEINNIELPVAGQ